MEKIRYVRVSSVSQNEERQKGNGYVKTFTDKCSGVIPFKERPAGKELLKYMEKHPTTIISVKSVDRLGRNTLDILNTTNYIIDKGWVLEIEDLGMNSNSQFFYVILSLLSSLSEHQRDIIKETQRQGIELRKAKGLYVGRKTGTTDNRVKTLTKHKDIVLLLEKKVKTTDIVNLTGKTRPTIYKVKKML